MKNQLSSTVYCAFLVLCLKGNPSGVSLEPKVKFSKHKEQLGTSFLLSSSKSWMSLNPVLLDTPLQWEVLYPRCTVSLHPVPVFLPALGEKVSPAVSPSRIHTSLLSVRFLYACYISHGSQTFLHFFVF